MNSARVTDRDDDGEPFDDGLPRLYIETTATNTSEESTTFGSNLLGIDAADGSIIGNEVVTTTFHPDLERTVDVEIIVDDESELRRGSLDVWVGAQVYDWTNLAYSGPEWSVPSWEAFVPNVPLTDERSS